MTPAAGTAALPGWLGARDPSVRLENGNKGGDFNDNGHQKGKPILSPSPLVAAMFMAELKNGLLTAGHDLDKVSLPLVLDVARGGERYAAMGARNRELKEGDMFLSDSEGILSSVLYGPDDRSYITANTSRALFTSYGAPSLAAGILQYHLEEIEAFVHILSPEAERKELLILG